LRRLCVHSCLLPNPGLSLSGAGYGQYGYHKGGCPGRCAKGCDKHEMTSKTYDCKHLKCCTQPKKGKGKC
uniref:Uncharacterized protein n=1 Tax=Chelydra serpentina TaxID=8475 RepID=A0A8C3XUU6_CHESE